MLARLFVELPFDLWVSSETEYKSHRYIDGDYEVIFHPLQKAERPMCDTTPDELTIDGIPAVCANVLQIDFKKDGFERKKGSKLDPPEDLISRTVNSFIHRLRYLMRAPHLQPIELKQSNWHIKYLNDDEIEIAEKEGLIRGYGTQTQRFVLTFAVASSETWTMLHDLGLSFELPLWSKLLLDAQNQVPNIGPIIVLSMTSLEVFISSVLDKLAAAKKVSPDFWKWLIYRRGQYLQEPSNEDRFDILLKFLAGHSLKEDSSLWTSFKHLKDARNSLVHEGIALIGKKSRTEVDLKKTLELVDGAWKIIGKIKEWLPKELHWPEFAPPSKIHAGKQIIGPIKKSQSISLKTGASRRI